MRKENSIMVVQGDILEVYFALENISVDTIDKVFFTCEKKGLQIECVYDAQAGEFALSLSSADTSDLLIGADGYDLTALLKDGNYFTLVYDGAFSVLEKKNKVSGV